MLVMIAAGLSEAAPQSFQVVRNCDSRQQFNRLTLDSDARTRHAYIQFRRNETRRTTKSLEELRRVRNRFCFGSVLTIGTQNS
jgi:hypothetical protein